MTFDQFIKLSEIYAWPITLTLTLIFYREVFRGLIVRVKKLTIGQNSAEFDNISAAGESAAAKSGTKEPSVDQINELIDSYEEDPRDLIMSEWNLISVNIIDYCVKKYKSDSDKRKIREKILLITQKDDINIETSELLISLFQTRNSVKRNGGRDISHTQLSEYAKNAILAKDILNKLTASGKK